MSEFGRDVGWSAAKGFILGFGTRVAFDRYNEKRMLKHYQETGEIPKKKVNVERFSRYRVIWKLGFVLCCTKSSSCICNFGNNDVSIIVESAVPSNSFNRCFDCNN